MLKLFTTTDRVLVIFSSLVFAICAFLLTREDLFEVGQGEKMGSIVEAQKDVRAKGRSGLSWRNVKSGRPLFDGDSVFTGSGSQASLEISEKRLLISENSLIRIEKSGGEMKLNLQFGEAIDQSTGEKLIPLEETEVVSSLSPARARRPKSSQKMVTLPSLKESFAEVWGPAKSVAPTEPTPAPAATPLPIVEVQPEPPAKVAAPQKRKPMRAPSQKSAIKSKPMPRKEIRLTQSEIVHPLHSRTPVRLQWSTNFKAKHFLIETSVRADLKKATRIRSKNLFVQLKSLTAPVTHFRVSALDDKGRMLAQSPMGLVRAKSPKPVIAPLKPIHKEARSPASTAPTASLKVEWSSVPMSSLYELELASNPQFKSPFRKNVSNNQEMLSLKKPGEYYIRVRALSADQKPISEYSDTATLTYEFLGRTDAPKLLEPQSGMSLVFQSGTRTPFWLTWSAVDSIDKYRLEFAKDEKFQNRILSELVPRTKFLVPYRLPKGKYYWRVRVEEGTQRSEWSTARNFWIYSPDKGKKVGR